MRCQASEAGAEGYDAPRRGVVGAGAALALGSLLELGAPQHAGAKVVSSDWELVRRQPAGSASQLLCSTHCFQVEGWECLSARWCCSVLSTRSYCAAMAAQLP